MCRCVRGILRKSAWAAALTVALFGATPSNAGTLTLDFNLASSTLTLGPVNVSNGMGATVSGAARVVLTGVNAAGMITGAMSSGTVSGLSLNFMVNTPLVAGLAANLVGPISITQMGSSSGPFAMGSVGLAQNTFNTNLSVNLDCQGAQCALVSQLGMIMFPIMQNAVISNNMGAFPVALSSLGMNAMFSASVMQMNAGQAVALNFNGQEVARMFAGGGGGNGGNGGGGNGGQVPEPVESGLLILGVLALCGVAAVRRQTA
jgi:hypothetical protein